MTNVIKTTMQNKSLVFKNDKHLSVLRDYVSLNAKDVVVKNYAYIDYEVVGGGAIFFFVPYGKWTNGDWDEKSDLKEIFIEFEKQIIGSNQYDYSKGILIHQNCQYVDNSHEAFCVETALKEAEYKAIEYIIDKG